MKSLIIPRSQYDVAKLQGAIYVLGGMNVLEGADGFTYENIYNIEVYDKEADAWYETALMILPPITNI